MTTEAEKELLLRVAAECADEAYLRRAGNWAASAWADLSPDDLDTIARVLREAAEGWIKITCANDLPKKPGKERYEYVECLIFHNGEIKMRPWNCEHLCWDDEEHDDFFCDAMEPSHYMKLPAPPSETGNG